MNEELQNKALHLLKKTLNYFKVRFSKNFELTKQIEELLNEINKSST